MEINNNRHNILSSNISPNPQSVKYWADLNADPTGGIIKRHDGKKWVELGSSNGSSNQIELLIARIEELENRLSALEPKVNPLIQDMPTVKNSINDLSSRVSALENI